MGRRGLVALAVLALASIGSPAPAPAESPQAEPIVVNSRTIRHFEIGSSETRFGALEFVGGLEMISPARDFGALSSFRFRDPGGGFVGVADTGFWFFGRIERGDDGVPTGVGSFAMLAMADAAGQYTREKWTTDAEGLALRGDLATVGFEREHRLTEFTVSGDTVSPPLRNLDYLVPDYELRSNRGFETVAHAPDDGPLAGARVIVAEKSIDKAGNLFAAIIEGPGRGIFAVARHDGFDAADGAFLANGDLLLLERRFNMASGIAVRLRRIPAAAIVAGSLADGPVVFEADMSYQIDNLEALDVWRRADGATMVSMMSDDNHSLLQRNLYLEFRLVE